MHTDATDTATETDEYYAALTRLPFVAENGSDLAYWSVEPSGLRDTDLELGEFYGRLALGAAKQFDEPLLTCMILRDMIASGKFGELEAGFIGVVVTAAKAGVMH